MIKCPKCDSCNAQYWRINKRLLTTEYMDPVGLLPENIDLDDQEYICGECGESPDETTEDKLSDYYAKVSA